MLDPFQLPYVQRGVLEILLLSIPAGLLGTWIVLRGLAFHAHAVGTAAFPGLVLGDGLGFAAGLGALGAALLTTAAVALLARRRGTSADSRTAIVLVAMLAAGIVLASDVFHSAARVDSLLFGSVLLLSARDVAVAAAVAVMAVAATAAFGPRWLAAGFDPEAPPARAGSSAIQTVLPVAVALAVVAALTAVGALMVTAIFVVPAATARLLTDRVGRWQAASIALAAVEGVAGIWLAVRLNAPPGATIAVLAGVVFAAALGARALRRRSPAARGPLLAALTLALAAALAGCGSGASGGDGSGDRLEVVATTTQVADFVRNVGGDRVHVTQILQPNTDPHSYEPRPDDVAAVAKAKVLFTSGDALDSWASKLVSQSGGSPQVVDLGADVPVQLPAAGGSASRVDPHWWHDPVNAQAAVARIRETLDRADPRGTPVYQARATNFLTRLGVLDKGIQACLAAIPRGRRTLVTDHDAFAYFAKRYGIDVVGAVIPSQSAAAQPSAADVRRLVGLIRARHVRAVFPETSLNARLAQAIARETGARVGAPLYGDTLGPKGSRGASYLGMEQANADAMARGFSGGRAGCPIPGIP